MHKAAPLLTRSTRAGWILPAPGHGLLGYTPRERAERAKFRGNIRGTRVTNRHVIEGALAYSVIAGLDEAHEVEKWHSRDWSIRVGRSGTRRRES